MVTQPNAAKVRALVDELEDLVAGRPGPSPTALRRCRELCRAFPRPDHSGAILAEKLAAVQEVMGAWFSARKWRRIPGGEQGARHAALVEVAKLRLVVERVFPA